MSQPSSERVIQVVSRDMPLREFPSRATVSAAARGLAAAVWLAFSSTTADSRAEVADNAGSTPSLRSAPVPSAEAERQQPADAAPRRVAVLGDSIVADGTLVQCLRGALGSGWRVDNYGVNSESPGHMVRRVRLAWDGRTNRVLVPTRYDYVVVLAGVNGIYPDVDARNGARVQLGKLLSRIKTLGNVEHHPKVVALTILPWGSWSAWSLRQERHTQIVNRWLLGAQREKDEMSVLPAAVDIAVDAYSELLDPTSTQRNPEGVIRPRMCSEYTTDGLHLSLRGAEHLAALLRIALIAPLSNAQESAGLVVAALSASQITPNAPLLAGVAPRWPHSDPNPNVRRGACAVESTGTRLLVCRS